MTRTELGTTKAPNVNCKLQISFIWRLLNSESVQVERSTDWPLTKPKGNHRRAFKWKSEMV